MAKELGYERCWKRSSGRSETWVRLGLGGCIYRTCGQHLCNVSACTSARRIQMTALMQEGAAMLMLMLQEHLGTRS